MIRRQRCIIEQYIQKEEFKQHLRMKDLCESRKCPEDNVWYNGYGKHETTRRWIGQVEWQPLHTSIIQEYSELIEAHIRRSHNGGVLNTTRTSSKTALRWFWAQEKKKMISQWYTLRQSDTPKKDLHLKRQTEICKNKRKLNMTTTKNKIGARSKAYRKK